MPRFMIRQPTSALTAVRQFLRDSEGNGTLCLRNIPGTGSRAITNPKIYAEKDHITAVKNRETGQKFRIGGHTIVDMDAVAMWVSADPHAERHLIFPTQLQAVDYLAYRNPMFRRDLSPEPVWSVDDLTTEGYSLGRQTYSWRDWDDASYDMTVDGIPVRFCIEEIIDPDEANIFRGINDPFDLRFQRFQMAIVG